MGFCGIRSRGQAQLGLSTIPERSARLYLSFAGGFTTRAFPESAAVFCFMLLCPEDSFVRIGNSECWVVCFVERTHRETIQAMGCEL